MSVKRDKATRWGWAMITPGRLLRSLPTCAVGALILAGTLAPACGGGGGGGRHALPAAADVIPASVPALISINTNFASGQWKNELALAERFPGAAGLFRRARAKSGLDFRRDVKPALGPEVDVTWLDFAHGGSDVVFLTQPKDPRKLTALIRKGNATGSGKLVTVEISGWTVAAHSRALLARFRRASSSGENLAHDGAFESAMSKLDESKAVRAYVAGRLVQAALDGSFERGGAPPNLTRSVGTIESLSGSLGAEGGGVRLDGGIAINPALKPESFAATLLGDLPAGALLYVSTNSLDDMLRTVLRLVSRSFPRFDAQLSQVEAVLDVNVRTDVLPLLGHETAFAVYPARPLPTFVVVIKLGGDTAKAKRIFDRLSSVIALGGGPQPEKHHVGGVEVTELDFPRALAPPVRTYFAAFDGKFAFTTSAATIRQLIEGPNHTLADDPAFKAARQGAGMPGKTTGLAYANLAQGLPFVFGLARSSGSVIPPAAVANTRPLRTALVYTEVESNSLRINGFATIK
jgi:Protein of unknown function (DUF3352)